MDAMLLEQINKLTCMVESPGNGETVRTRPTIKPDMKYITTIARVGSQLPVHYRQMLCCVQNLYIEKDINYFRSNGYAWFHDFTNIRNLRGPFLQLSQSVLDASLDGSETVATNLLRKVSRLSKDPKVTDQVKIESNAPGLVYLLSHEITHLFDMYNGLNCMIDDQNARRFFEHCADSEFRDGSFAKFSWLRARTPICRDDSTLFGKLLRKVYPLDGDYASLTAAEVTTFLVGLYEKSDFITSYSLLDPFEDLAELCALLIVKELNPAYYLQVSVREESGWKEFDVFKLIESERMEQKVRYIRENLLEPGLRFPQWAD